MSVERFTQIADALDAAITIIDNADELETKQDILNQILTRIMPDNDDLETYSISLRRCALSVERLLQMKRDFEE